MISSIEDTIYETVAPGNMQCKFVDTNHCFSGDVTEKEWTYYEHYAMSRFMFTKQIFNTRDIDSIQDVIYLVCILLS